MSRVTLVRYTTKPGRADENEALAAVAFAGLRASAPAGVTYAMFRDGSDFTHLFVNRAEADSAVLTELPAFKAYAKDIGERCVAPPEVLRLDTDLREAYGLGG